MFTINNNICIEILKHMYTQLFVFYILKQIIKHFMRMFTANTDASIRFQCIIYKINKLVFRPSLKRIFMILK